MGSTQSLNLETLFIVRSKMTEAEKKLLNTVVPVSATMVRAYKYAKRIDDCNGEKSLLPNRWKDTLGTYLEYFGGDGSVRVELSPEDRKLIEPYLISKKNQ